MNRAHRWGQTGFGLADDGAHGVRRPTFAASSCLDVEVNIHGEGDGEGAGSGGDGPQKIPLAGGEGEGGDDDASLRGEHAVKEFGAAGVMLLGGHVSLANLQFIKAGDGLVQLGLGVESGGRIGKTGGGEIAKAFRSAAHELRVEFIGSGVDGFGGGVKTIGGIGGVGEGFGDVVLADVGKIGGDFRFGPAFGKGVQSGFHAVVIFGAGDGGQLIFGEGGYRGGIGIRKGIGGERPDGDAGGEEIEGIMGEGAAGFFGGGKTPLIAGLGLELGGGGAVVLGAGHLAGGESGEHGGNDGHDDRGGGEDLAPRSRGQIGFEGCGNFGFCGHGRSLMSWV